MYIHTDAVMYVCMHKYVCAYVIFVYKVYTFVLLKTIIDTCFRFSIMINLSNTYTLYQSRGRSEKVARFVRAVFAEMALLFCVSSFKVLLRMPTLDIHAHLLVR